MQAFDRVSVSVYRTRDLLLLPNVLSAARIPLAFAFPIAVRRRRIDVALSIMLAAAATDVLDGFAARLRQEATPIGAVVDGVADKIFGASVLGTLVASRMLGPWSALLLATRELGELPLAVRLLVRRNEALAGNGDRRANVLGKIATALELAVVLAVLFRMRRRAPLLGAAAAFGVLAAASYWRRERL